MVRRFDGTAEDAKDLVQETFFRLPNRGGDVREAQPGLGTVARKWPGSSGGGIGSDAPK